MKATLDQPVTRKTISQMTTAELQEAIRPTAEKLKQETFEKNTYFSYYDETLCPDDDTVIFEYKDRKELMRIDDEGNAELIKVL